MALIDFTDNVEIIQELGTFPNQDDGLSAEELKAKFDEAAKRIKAFINEWIVPQHNSLEQIVSDDYAAYTRQYAELIEKITVLQQAVESNNLSAEQAINQLQIDLEALTGIVEKYNSDSALEREQLRDDLALEISTRTHTDETLSQRIDQETADRIAADEEVLSNANTYTDAQLSQENKQRLDAETALREADAVLTDSVNNLADEMVISNRERIETEEELSARVSELESGYRQISAPIICKASGNAVSLSNASNCALAGLTLYGRTLQDGVPSPDTPVPLEIAGAGGSTRVTVTGKNLITVTKTPINARGITWTVQEDGSVKVTGTATEVTWFSRAIPYGDDEMTTLAPGTYFLSGNKPDSGVGMYLVARYSGDIGDSTDSPRDSGNGAVCILERACQAYIQMVVDSGVTVNTVIYPQLEVGTAATSYEPYKVQSLTLSTPNGLPGMLVSSGGNYTDETGQQWLCDEIDYARGVYIKRLATDILTGEEEWSEYPDKPGVFYATGTGIADGGMCSHYPVKYSFVDGAIYLSYTKNNIICDARFTGNVEGLKAFLVEQHAAGTPVTVLRRLRVNGGGGEETALSAEELAAFAALHTNKPNTTVYNDSGARMALEYVADTKTYIDNKFAELSAALVNTV